MQPLVIITSQGLRRIKEAYTPIGGVINIRINNAFIAGGDELLLFDAEGLVNITLDNDGLMVFGFMEPIKNLQFSFEIFLQPMGCRQCTIGQIALQFSFEIFG